MNTKHRPPIHPDLSTERFDDILKVYAFASDVGREQFDDGIDQLVISHQLWDLFEQRHPKLAAEHRAAVDVSLALGRACG